MEFIQLVISDPPWKFIIPLQPVQVHQHTIVVRISHGHLKNQMSLDDLQEWLELERSYDLHLESRNDSSGPIAIVQARLEQLDRQGLKDHLELTFHPVRGLEDLEEYVNYRRAKNIDGD